MRLTKLRGRAFGPYRGDFAIPLDDIGAAQVVGLRGPNGAGKTSMLELPFAAWSRFLPGRGPQGERPPTLAAFAVAGEKAFLEAAWTLDDGRVVEVEHHVNAARATPTAEAYLRVDGVPLSDGKLTDFDAAVARIFPPAEVYLLSAWGSRRNRGSFLSTSSAQRAAALAAMLGLERMGRLSAAAGSRAQLRRAEVEKLEERLAALRGQTDACGADFLNEMLRDRAAVAGAESALRGAMTLRERRRLAEGAAFAEKSRMEHAVAERRRDFEKVQEVARQAKDAAERAHGALQGACDRVETLTERLTKEPGLRSQVQRGEAAAAEVQRLETEQREADAARTAATQKHAEWRQAAREAETAAREARREVETWQTQRAHAIDTARKDLDRLARAAGLLGKVPCKGVTLFGYSDPNGRDEHPDMPVDCGTCDLLGDARAAAERLPEAEDRLRILEAEQVPEALAAPAQATHAEDMRLRSNPPPAPVYDNHAEHVRVLALNDARLAVRAGTHAAGELAALDAVRIDLASAEDAKEKADTAAIAEMSAAGVAEAVAALREEELRVVEAETEKAIAALEAGLPEAPSPEEVLRLEADLIAARERVARAEGKLEAAKKAEAEAATVEATLRDLAGKVDRWAYLQRALGRTGVQAFEIDAAGPRVSALAMRLLEPFGGRFEPRIITSAPKAGGKGTKEVCDLAVVDTQGGREGSADWLSDGEQAVVGEALALAIATYNGERGAVRPGDIYRDEISGSLDVENARRYVELLHLAVRVGGFGRVWFVAHQPALWDLADAMLVVENGEVKVDG